MKKIPLAIPLLLASAFGQTINANVLPATTGFNLGSSAQRWNGFFQNVDVSGTITGLPTFSGNNNFTGSNTFGNINNDLYVSSPSVSGTYTTCQAAVTAAGASNRIIHIPPDYNGPDCPLNVGKNIMLWNEDSTRLYVNDGFNWFQNTGGNTDSTIHVMGARSTIGAGGAFVTGYFTSTLQNGVVGTGIGVDGIAAEANTTGTLTGTLPVLSAAENSTLIGSTGGAILKAYATQSYCNSLGGSTTTWDTCIGFYGLGGNSLLGVHPDKSYGLFGEQQTGGITRNYALGAKGFSLLLYSASQGAGGFDCEDTSGVAHHCWYIDVSNDTNIQCAQTVGCFFRDSGGATRMGLTSSGVRIGDGSVAAFGFDIGTNAGFQGAKNFLLEQAQPQAGLAGWTVYQAGNVDHMWHFNPNAAGDQHVPQAVHILTNYANATTTFSTVTGMSWSIAASVNYRVDCTFVGQGSATTAGPKFQLTGPASPTLVKLMVDGGTNTTAYANGVATGFSSANATLGTLGAGTTDFIWHVNADVVNGSTAGTLVLQAAANGAGTVTISGGSCQIQ